MLWIFYRVVTKTSHEQPPFTGGKLRLGREAAGQRAIPQGRTLKLLVSWKGVLSLKTPNDSPLQTILHVQRA